MYTNDTHVLLHSFLHINTTRTHVYHVVKLDDIQVPQSELDSDTVKSILSEYKIHNADITLRYDATSDDLIDVIEGNRIYVPCIYLLNKIGKFSIFIQNTFLTFVLIQIKSALRNWMSYTRFLIACQFPRTTNGISTTYWRRCGST